MVRSKQAVVLIHGIGEQRPMDTLRSFVEAVLPDTRDSAQRKYRNKPDQMSESFELRCLQAPGDHSSHRPITDFYEFYWAHHTIDSKYSSVLSWIGGLLLRPFWKVPTGLRSIYGVAYIGLFLVATLLFWGLIDQTGGSPISRIVALYEKKQLYMAIAVLVLQAIGSRYILGYLADAARYLTPSPENIGTRNQIRAEGIKLLRTLHESGKYIRIVVVGHSLGSIIGYDILRHLWVDLRESQDPHNTPQPSAKTFDATIEAMQNRTKPVTNHDVELFQQKQHKLWREHRGAGIPWLVTDFITLGSPLAHAALLMADGPKEFEQRIFEFEFPTCPPSSVQESHYQKEYVSYDLKQPISVRIPHHGAMFSSTRWTNLYFPHKWLAFGDLIGGPLAESFGNGIRDIPVRPSKGGLLRKSLYCHVCYWEPPVAYSKTRGIKRRESDCLKSLQSVLRLDCLHAKEPWPNPTGLCLLHMLLF